MVILGEWRGATVLARIVTFKISEHLLSVLDSYARENNLSRSEVIRKAIEKLLEAEGYNTRGRHMPVDDPRTVVIEITV